MPQEVARLERLISDELGDCCEADIEDRLASLEAYQAEIPRDPTAHLRALKTLGNETRYRITRLLAAADGELCVCEINPVIEVSDSAISHALSDLHDAGLVSRRKDGTWRFYQVTALAESLLGALDQSDERDR